MTSRDLSLAEFSHLAPAPQLLSAPARGDSAPPPLVIAGGGAVVAVVTPPRLQEKVMVALTAARAARVQALEVSRWAGMELGHWSWDIRAGALGPLSAVANTLPHSHICHTNTSHGPAGVWSLWPA